MSEPGGIKFTTEELHAIWKDFVELNVDYDEEYDDVVVLNFDELVSYNSEFAESFLDYADRYLKVLEEVLSKEFNIHAPVVIKGETMHDRERTIFSHNGKIKLTERDANSLVMFTGQLVSKLKEKKSRYTEIAYRCSDCGSITRVPQNLTSEKLKEPEECSVCGKKRGRVHFSIVPEESKMEDYIHFTLQEIEDENFAELHCILRDSARINRWNLVIGDVYTVVGILRFKQENTRKITGSYYIDVLGIKSSGEEELEITYEDEQMIKKYSENPDIVDVLKAHIAPDVYGWQDVKEILLLQLVGGVTVYSNNHTSQSGNIHVLLIGDPGTAKTELMRSIKHLAPKAVDAMGTASSNAGLTVAAVKDAFTGEWAYLAGVLPRANGGVAIVDELDKLLKKEKDFAFLEALESQTVSKNTAAGSVKFKTDFAFLGGANPKYGKWDGSYGLKEQVDLTPQLFSRLDFVYVMRDVVDEVTDRMVARVLLSMGPEETNMEQGLFKKYIAYARRLKPRMSKAAMKILEEYFLNLRKKDSSVTYRQIRTLRKIAAAYAKLKLHEEITEQDAKDATDMYDRYLASWGFQASQINFGESSRELEIKKEMLLYLARQNAAPYEELLIEVLDRTGYGEEDVREVLDKLIEVGTVKKIGPLIALIEGVKA